MEVNKKRRHSSPTPDKEQRRKRPIFTSYLDTPNLPPKIKLLCEIVANTPSLSIEKVLDETGVRVCQETVEEVLKLSYSYPGPAVKFFRWSAYQLNDKHSPYAWNLVVDLLGKNLLFDAMWDAIKSMKKEGLISIATFASVFSSYVMIDRVQDAIMTFEVLEQYGVNKDIIALNSLLSAICRDGKTVNAMDFLHVVKDRIRPDSDTYAILLESFENEGDVVSAKRTFGEMVIEVGWDPSNVPAYDSLLNTLLKSRDGIYEAIKFFQTMTERGCFPGMRFFKGALEECMRNYDVKGADLVWEAMVGRMGFRPDTRMYNTMIALHCYSNSTSVAIKLLDEMIYNGAFPDSETYNVLFQFLIKCRKLREASSLFDEAVKNECILSQENCGSAVRIYMGSRDPYMAIKIWKYMIENSHSILEETGNFLVVELCYMDMHQEATKYAEGMIERGIKLTTTTLSKLKESFSKARKLPLYDKLYEKWRAL